MKKLLLLIVAVVASAGVMAQVTFFVEPNSPNVGDYDVTFANQGGGTSWSVMPDLEDPANSVSGTLVIVQGVDSLGCETLTNFADVAGNIAMVWRGDCQFGTKALAAQAAGAIAVVIVNHSGDPVGMAAGDDGVFVTIPVVMISTSAAAIIYDEVVAGTLTAFIGNKTGLYGNDLGISDIDILRAKQFAVPSALAQNASEFSVQPGGWVYNYGFEDQTNVVLNCEIVGAGVTAAYNETSTPVNIASGDSVYFTFPLFSQSSYPVAYYNMTYTVSSDSVDDFSFDNDVSADFAVSEEAYTHSRVAENDLENPISNVGFFTDASFLTACTHFVDPNASRLIPTSVSFSAYTPVINDQVFLFEQLVNGNGDTVDVAKTIELNVYEWNDALKDVNDANWDITSISIATDESTYEYEYTADLQGVTVTRGITPFVMEDNQSYLFCATTFDNQVYLGFDNKVNYSENIVDYSAVAGGTPSVDGGIPTTVLQSDAGGTITWNVSVGQQAAVGINFAPVAELSVEEVQNVSATAFPNPANQNVTVLLKDFSGSGDLTVVDLEGRVVISNTVTVDGSKLSVDVSQLASGMYVFNLNLENGKSATFNVVVNK